MKRMVADAKVFSEAMNISAILPRASVEPVCMKVFRFI